jgi:ElaB/YqjD/DUF883 family membrane-anchored ribosome-binding protein
MAGATSLHDELDILRAELGRKEPREQPESVDSLSAKNGSDPEPQAEAMAELKEQLGELGKALSEHTGGIEDFVKAQPLVSVLAAFALGIAVGRLMGKA